MLTPIPAPLSNPATGTSAPPPAPLSSANGSAQIAPWARRRTLQTSQTTPPSSAQVMKNSVRKIAFEQHTA